MGRAHASERRTGEHSNRQPRRRRCLNKLCERPFTAGVWNQRYCQDPSCLREVERWLARKRKERERETEAGREANREATRRCREKAKARQAAPAESAGNPATLPEEGPGCSHAATGPVCDRPGCFQARPSRGLIPIRYCGTGCRRAIRRVLDRERKWLLRSTEEGRRRRRRENRDASRRRKMPAVE